MSKLKIASVEYLNALPFTYGVQQSGLIDADLQLVSPAECAEKLVAGEVDMALVPVGALPLLGDDVSIVTSYCIGATGAVRTVVLLSDEPINKIERIWLDADSRTSVKLLAHLCEHHFHITPEWRLLDDVKRVESAQEGDAFLLIGDKVFDHEGVFEYSTDLAEEWLRHSSMPFAFAVWCARCDVEEQSIEALEEALTWGVERTYEALRSLRPDVDEVEGYTYLTQNIDPIFDGDKRRAMEMFQASKSLIKFTQRE